MKDEIKEILDKWKCYIELTKKFTTNEYEMLRVKDIDKIIDYITNLQERNEKALEINQKLQSMYILDSRAILWLGQQEKVLQGEDKDD